MSGQRYSLNERLHFTVTRSDANFDRACDAACSIAAVRFGVDESGHIDAVEGSCRTTDSIHVMFESHECIAGMQGSDHVYHFEATVRRNEA